MEHKYANNVAFEISYQVLDLQRDIEKAGGFNSETVKKYPITASDLSFEIVDNIISLIRLQKTKECYDTHGSLNDDEVLVDLSQKIGWTIRKPYQDLLLKICSKMNCVHRFDMIVRTDQSFRLKRAKGHSWVYFTCTIPPQQAMAFDLTYRTSITEDINGHVPIIFKPVRQCAHCKKDAMSNCGRCKNMFYCSKTCQREHWKTHKTTCQILVL
jgi:hypothetical protein